MTIQNESETIFIGDRLRKDDPLGDPITKEGRMNPSLSNLFNYQEIEAHLLMRSKSMRITLKSEYLNKQMLFELESLFNWLSSHPEINAVIMQNSQEYFCHGFDSQELLHMNDQQHYDVILRVQKLAKGMFYLPQTIIVDLGQGASSMGAELSCGADFRIARKGPKISFCSITNGRVNSSGGIGLLELIVNANYSRQWNLMDGPICSEQLYASGFIAHFYSDADGILSKMLKKISAQSPLARIQTKRSLMENIRYQLENLKEREFSFASSALGQRDWQEAIIAKSENRQANFVSVKEVSEALQENKREFKQRLQA